MGINQNVYTQTPTYQMPVAIWKWLYLHINGSLKNLQDLVKDGHVETGYRPHLHPVKLEPFSFQVRCRDDFSKVIVYWADDKEILESRPIFLMETMKPVEKDDYYDPRYRPEFMGMGLA